MHEKRHQSPHGNDVYEMGRLARSHLAYFAS